MTTKITMWISGIPRGTGRCSQQLQGCYLTYQEMCVHEKPSGGAPAAGASTAVSYTYAVYVPEPNMPA